MKNDSKELENDFVIQAIHPISGSSAGAHAGKPMQALLLQTPYIYILSLPLFTNTQI